MSLIDDDRPHPLPLPTDRYWSENYCFAGFDPASGLGLWLHSGRWILDPHIWREVVILRFPDGSVAAHRGYGKATESRDGPGGPNLAIRVLEDRRRFSLSFHGAIRRVHNMEMAGALLTDGPVERLQMKLEFTSDLPIWDMHGVSDSQDFAGTGHVEQPGTIRGPIEIGSQRFDYDGFGHRDHSRGPRDATKLKTHHWLQGRFDNGIGFAVYHAVLVGETKAAFAKAAVWEGDRMFDATVALPFMITRSIDATRPYGFAIDYAKGRLDIQVTDVPTTAFLCFSIPNEEYVGVVPAPQGKQPLVLLEQSAFYKLADGTIGHGMMERSVPGEVYREIV